MNTDRLDLSKRYQELSDDELMALCGSGNLNEVAQSVAFEELRVRGLQAPRPVREKVERAEDEGDFVTVAQFLNPTDAHIVRGLLEASGIRAVVGDANLVQMNNLWAVAIGGVRVRVPAARVPEARAAVAAYNRGDLALRDEEDGRRDA